jgi:N-methylhydantoinase B
MEVGSLDDAPFAINAYYDRIHYPPRGRDGGKGGAAGEVQLASGGRLNGKGQQTIPMGDRVLIRMPGGGGLGDPRNREAHRVAEDVRLGLVSREAARNDYCVVVAADGSLEEAATAQLRADWRD